ncbi:MAG: hypothetical protein LBC29_07360 [Propionibacteriaceae bacterium]|jgi:hypothetical protein|nr:hypothetical protein [Propionibacteriaceae bacterium]
MSPATTVTTATAPNERAGFGTPHAGLGWLSLPQLLFFAAVAAAAGFVGTLSQFTWEPSRWAVMSSLFHEALILAAPLAMICAASVARRRHAVVCGVAPGRGWAAIATRQLLAIEVAVIAGFTLGLTPALVRTAIRATAAGPGFVVIFSGLALLAAWVSLGFLFGALVRAPYSYVLCVVVALALNFLLLGLVGGLTKTSYTYFSVLPYWGTTPTFTQHEALEVALIRLGWAVAFTAGFVWLVGRLGRPLRGSGVLQRLGDAAVALLLPAAVLTIGVVRNPYAFTTPDPLPASCAMTEAGIEICVPQDIADLLPLAKQGAESVFQLVGTAQFSGTIGPENVVFRSSGASPEIYETGAATQVAVEIAATKPYPSACMRDETHLSATGEVTSGVSSAIMMRMQFGGEDYEPFGVVSNIESETRLLRLTNAEFRRWLDENGAAVRACQLTLDDLP